MNKAEQNKPRSSTRFPVSAAYKTELIGAAKMSSNRKIEYLVKRESLYQIILFSFLKIAKR